MEVKVLGGAGLHASEVKAVYQMETNLRDSWFGYAGLVVADNQGSMEIDTLIITHDRILLVELKEWNGVIEQSGGQWYQNGKARGKSPYQIKREHAQRLKGLLKTELEHRLGYFLHIEAHVVLCGDAMVEKLTSTEKPYVHTLEEFLKISTEAGYNSLTQDTKLQSFFANSGKPRPNSSTSLPIIQEFFSGPNITPKRLREGGYTADESAWFEHRKGIYSEYSAQHDETPNIKGLMRRWDFSRLGTDNALQTTWAEIALRESRIGRHVRDVSTTLPDYLLRSVKEIAAEDVTEDLTELYELRRSHIRLDNLISKEASNWTKDMRIDRVRALLTPFAELHSLGIGHRDIDSHNLWYAKDQKSIVVSGFSTAFFSERGTLSDFRKLLQSTDIKLPEDVLATDGDILDSFRLDVFMLAVVSYRLCFGGENLRLEEGIPEWKEPSNDIFEGRLNKWFEKGLSWVATERFSTANEMLSELNSLTQDTIKKHDDSLQIYDSLMKGTFVKKDLYAFNLQNIYPLAPNESQSINSNKIKYISICDNRRLLVKLWPNVNVNQDQPGLNRRIHQFKRRAESIKSALLPTPEIIDFGILNMGGLFVVSNYEEGETWREFFDRNEVSIETKLVLSLKLVETMQLFHEKHVFHGDLHVENILISNYHKDDIGAVRVRLLDLLDFGNDSNPHNTEYGPINPAVTDASGRDRYAIFKIIEEVLDQEVPQMIEEEISRSKDLPNSIPISLEPLEDVLKKPYPADDSDLNEEKDLDLEMLVIRWGNSDFPSELKILDHIDNGYYFNCKWGKARGKKSSTPFLQCYITSESSSLQINVDVEERTISSIYFKDNVPLSDIVSAAQRSSIAIKNIVAIQKGQIDISDRSVIDFIMNLEPVIDLISERFSIEESGFEEFNDLGDEKSISPDRIWKALAETEGELRETLIIDSSDYKFSPSGYFLYQYTMESGQDLAIDDEDSLVIYKKDSDRGPIGEIYPLETTVNTVSIKLYNDSFRKRIKSGTRLQLETVRNKSSREVRHRALDRVLKGGSVISDLPKYFDANQSIVMQNMLDEPSDNFYREIYDTDDKRANKKQIEAFKKLISFGPVGVLQGPPGTGKTTFVSKFIHYLYNYCGVQNILLVGQSHTAVDNVALKAIELSNEKGVEIQSVRIGQEQMIDESMLSSHSEALQRQIRQKFHREYDLRINALAKHLSMPNSLVEALTRVYRTLNPLLESLRHYRKSLSELRKKTDDSESISNVESNIEIIKDQVEKVVDSIFDCELKLDLSIDADWMSALFSHVAESHNFNNPSEILRLKKLLTLSQDWLDVLQGGEAGYERFMIKTKQLVCGTLVGVGRRKLELENSVFDWVIVDEAGRAQAAELMVALQCGKRVLLVGDHKQLPPFYHRSHLMFAAQKISAREAVFYESDFEKAFKVTGGVTLDTQYRMVEPIGNLVSECFYSDDIGKLHTGRGGSPDWFNLLPAPWDKPVTWVDSTSDSGETELSKGRYVNRTEVENLMFLLRKLISDSTLKNLRSTVTKEQPYPIGIITMYRAQKDEIEMEISRTEWMGPLRSLIKIDTVDSYQGQENKIIILSLVRDNEGSIQGFLGDEPRINVAISRAQERLVILGASRMWESNNNDSALGSVQKFITSNANEQPENYQVISNLTIQGGV